MAGRFEGLSDLEWKLFEDIFSEEPSKRGSCMPHAPYPYAVEARQSLRKSKLIFVLIIL